jgi:hypothetical protein
VYFMVIWHILWPLGNVVVIWYIFPCFGILCQEKSGSPGSYLVFWFSGHVSDHPSATQWGWFSVEMFLQPFPDFWMDQYQYLYPLYPIYPIYSTASIEIEPIHTYIQVVMSHSDSSFLQAYVEIYEVGRWIMFFLKKWLISLVKQGMRTVVLSLAGSLCFSILNYLYM